MEIKGTAAVVTGGASGLGAATARALSDGGAFVVIVDIDDERGAQLADELGGRYARADVTDSDAVEAAIETAAAAAPLRILVNCAGIARPARTIGRDGSYESAHSLDAFSRIVSVNLIGTFNCIRLAATAMSRTEPLDADGQRGSIVNTASIAAFDGQVGQASYSASKAGIIGMTLPVARDLAPVGIRINTIAPGLIDTPIYEVMDEPEAFKEQLKRDVLFPRRLGVSEEFASLALEFITNDYLNAEVLRLDAGTRMRAK